MDVARNIILGLLFVSLGFAAFANIAALDPLLRFCQRCDGRNHGQRRLGGVLHVGVPAMFVRRQA